MNTEQPTIEQILQSVGNNGAWVCATAFNIKGMGFEHFKDKPITISQAKQQLLDHLLALPELQLKEVDTYHGTEYTDRQEENNATTNRIRQSLTRAIIGEEQPK